MLPPQAKVMPQGVSQARGLLLPQAMVLGESVW